jgi:hypothetical protein
MDRHPVSAGRRDDDEQRRISDAQIAETTYTAFGAAAAR